MSQISDSRSFRGSGKRSVCLILQTFIKVLAYPKTNYPMRANLVSYMVNFIQSTNQKRLKKSLAKQTSTIQNW